MIAVYSVKNVTVKNNIMRLHASQVSSVSIFSMMLVIKLKSDM